MNVLCAYRYFKHEIRHLSYLSEDLDSRNRCPACSEVCFNIFNAPIKD